MAEARAGNLRAMYIMGENPVLSDPDMAETEAALAKLDFLIVQDIFPTETSRYAHVVLPGASFAEKDGTFTNTERRIQRIRRAIRPVGESLPDWQIICQLSPAWLSHGVSVGRGRHGGNRIGNPHLWRGEL